MAAHSSKKVNLFRRSLIYGYMVDFEYDGSDTGGFVYWEPDQSILGLTVFDGMAHVYEKNLSKEERKELLLNPADTLLEAKWNIAMKEKSVQVGNFSGGVAQLTYLDQTISLPRIVDVKEIAKRQEKQFTLYMREIKELSALTGEVAGVKTPKKPTSAGRLASSQPMFGRRRTQTGAAGPSSKVPKLEQDSDEEYAYVPNLS